MKVDERPANVLIGLRLAFPSRTYESIKGMHKSQRYLTSWLLSESSKAKGTRLRLRRQVAARVERTRTQRWVRKPSSKLSSMPVVGTFGVCAWKRRRLHGIVQELYRKNRSECAKRVLNGNWAKEQKASHWKSSNPSGNRSLRAGPSQMNVNWLQRRGL